MSQSGANGVSGTPGQVDVTLTIGGPNATPPSTHPGVAAPPPNLPTTGIPVAAEVDAALLAVVAGALVVRLTSDGTRELLGLLRRARRGATS